MISKLTYVVLLASALPGINLADTPSSYEEIVEQAFRTLGDDYKREWAYTETSIDDERTWVGRYDPSRPADRRWSLESVDGRAPTADERKEWLADRSHDGDGRNEGHDRDPGIVSPGSLVLLEENDSTWLFGFTPTTDDDDEEARDFMAQVDGSLRVRKDGPWLEELKLSNEGPIRVAVGVRFSRFLTHLRFARPEPLGPVVPLSVDVNIKGRAFLAIGIDEQESTRFSDYERVVPMR